MFKEAVYNQTKALIGYLEERVEMLEKENVSNAEAKLWMGEIEMAWKAVCRRTDAKRGPYERRNRMAA